MRRQLQAALGMLLLFTVITGIVYPLAVTGMAQALFSDRADGSYIERDGRVVGSSLIGQPFKSPEYFHPRPSAVTYDGSLSSGSNLGPTSADLLAAVARRAERYREQNGLPPDAEVPVDAVTASGSGLDPDISVANARLQAPRVADVRGMDVTTVDDLITEHTAERTFGFLGEPRVNVLELNLALDDARE
jgi:potassium-transporting ATPase KdpC subunit